VRFNYRVAHRGLFGHILTPVRVSTWPGADLGAETEIEKELEAAAENADVHAADQGLASVLLFL